MNKYSAELNNLIDRINELHKKVSEKAQPSFIDLHLLCDYTRKYYDLLIAANAIAGAVPVTNISTFEIKQIAKENFPASDNNFRPDVEHAPVKVEEEKKVIAEPELQTAPQPESITIPKTSTEKFKEYTSIGDKFPESQTVAHKFTGGQSNAVTENIKASPLADLNDAIGINERFAFANVFMNGDINSFYSALAKINSKPNFDEAFNHFRTEVVEKFNVDKNNKLYREFIELLQRRFMK
jgi:hypothetical protein